MLVCRFTLHAVNKTTSLEKNSSANFVYVNNQLDIYNWAYNINLDDNLKSVNYFGGNIQIIPKPDYLKDESAFGQVYNRNLITTPFKRSAGNPIAFAPMGIDTPKTFNYKMLEQNRARLWMISRHEDDMLITDNYPARTLNGILKTTMAQTSSGLGSINYKDSYIDEIDLYAEGGKRIDIYHNMEYTEPLPQIEDEFYKINPFLPGLTTYSSKGYVESQNSLYHPNKTAGVDSLGLLMGAIATSEIDGNFINVFNTEVNNKNDEYNKAKPDFHVNQENNILNKPYRFTKSDIEKSTILLPNLSMARPGDILVNFTKNQPHVGIIVSADFSGLNSNSSTEEFMERITVVSTRSGYRMANVGVWKNPNNIFSGFTAPGEEKSYHLRRLITKPLDSKSNLAYVKDKIELFDTELTELDVDLVMEKDTHWVPNTGELFKFKKIVIKGNYASELLSLKNEDKDITILPPLDQYYFDQTDQQAANDKSNIYRNKGDGFKFYAVNGVDAIYLATFKLKNNATIVEGESPYEVEYNTDIFNDIDDGRVKNNFKLYVENDKLAFKIVKGRIKKKLYTSFAIRPLEDNIRPGDDLLLRFGLQKNHTISGTVNDEDFLAVYDKKMLWRANLYLDEGDYDWNNLNPWNAPASVRDARNLSGEFKVDNTIIQRYLKVNGDIDYLISVPINGAYVNVGESIWYGPNEWNHIMRSNEDAELFSVNSTTRDGLSMEWEDLTRLANGNGKQVVQYPSAVYYNNLSNATVRLTSDTVVYNYYRTSTPFEYKYHMNEQYKAMKKIGDDLKSILDTAKAVYSLSPTLANKTALETAQVNYDDCIYKELQGLLNPETQLPPMININTGVNGDFSGPDVTTLINKPQALELWKRYDKLSYKPAAKDTLRYSSSPGRPFEQPPNDDTEYDGVNGIYSDEEAGVDCGGLVFMSEAYIGTPYIRRGYGNKPSAVDGARYVGNFIWSIHDCGLGTQHNAGQTDQFDVNNNLYQIMNYDEYDFDLNEKSENRNKIVPGDIIYHWGYHVMIVNGHRLVELKDIEVIESTHMNKSNIYGVGNTNTLNTYKDEIWYLGRIKTK